MYSLLLLLLITAWGPGTGASYACSFVCDQQCSRAPSDKDDLIEQLEVKLGSEPEK
jgi:hypothetical protein